MHYDKKMNKVYLWYRYYNYSQVEIFLQGLHCNNNDNKNNKIDNDNSDN